MLTSNKHRYATKFLLGSTYQEIRDAVDIPPPRPSVDMKFAQVTSRYWSLILHETIRRNIQWQQSHPVDYNRMMARLRTNYSNCKGIHWPFSIPILAINPMHPTRTITLWDKWSPTPEMIEVNNKLDEPCAVAIGPILLTHPIIANYRSNNNWLDGMRKRMIHEVNFDPNVMHAFDVFCKRLVRKFEPLPHVDINLDNQNLYWLDPCKHYTVAQKEKHRANMKLFMEIGFEAYKEQYHDLYACLSFIKREFYSELKAARIINSRTDEFKSIVGAHIKMIENEVTHNEHYVKKISLDERAIRMQEILDKFDYVTEDDYSSFEGTQSQEFHRACERHLFKHMLRNNPELWHIMKPIFSLNHFEKSISMPSKDLKDSMKFKGSRMSGDLWTSLGNGFSNECVFLFVMERMKRQMPNGIPLEYDYLVEGDDGFFAANVDFTEMFEQTATDLGLKCKIDHGTSINDVSFCSTCLGPGRRSVPNFWRILEKFGWEFSDAVLTHYSSKPSKHELQLLYAKALSLNCVSLGIPILQKLSVKLAEITGVQRRKVKYFTYLDLEVHDIMDYNIQEMEVTEEMRLFFQNRFGVSVAKQLEIEEMIDKQTSPRFIIPLRRMSDNEIALAREDPSLLQ